MEYFYPGITEKIVGEDWSNLDFEDEGKNIPIGFVKDGE